MEVRSVEQDLVTNVGLLVHASVSVEGWFINIFEHGPLDGPGSYSLPAMEKLSNLV